MSRLKLAQSVLNLSEVDAWQLFLRELKGCAVPNSSLPVTRTLLFPFSFNGVTLHLPARLDDKPWRSAGRAVQSGDAISWEIGCLQVEPRAALLRSGGLRSWFLDGLVRRLEKIATPGKAAAVEIADEDIQAIKGAWARCQFDQDDLVRRLSNVSGEYLGFMFQAFLEGDAPPSGDEGRAMWRAFVQSTREVAAGGGTQPKPRALLPKKSVQALMRTPWRMEMAVFDGGYGAVVRCEKDGHYVIGRRGDLFLVPGQRLVEMGLQVEPHLRRAVKELDDCEFGARSQLTGQYDEEATREVFGLTYPEINQVFDLIAPTIGDRPFLDVNRRNHDRCEVTGALIPPGWPYVILPQSKQPPFACVSLGAFYRLVRMSYLQLLPEGLTGLLLRTNARDGEFPWRGEDGRFSAEKIREVLWAATGLAHAVEMQRCNRSYGSNPIRDRNLAARVVEAETRLKRLTGEWKQRLGAIFSPERTDFSFEEASVTLGTASLREPFFLTQLEIDEVGKAARRITIRSYGPYLAQVVPGSTQAPKGLNTAKVFRGRCAIHHDSPCDLGELIARRHRELVPCLSYSVRFRDAADLDAQLAKLLAIIVPGASRHVSVKQREGMPPPYPQELVKLAEEVQALPDAGRIQAADIRFGPLLRNLKLPGETLAGQMESFLGCHPAAQPSHVVEESLKKVLALYGQCQGMTIGQEVLSLAQQWPESLALPPFKESFALKSQELPWNKSVMETLTGYAEQLRHLACYTPRIEKAGAVVAAIAPASSAEALEALRASGLAQGETELLLWEIFGRSNDLVRAGDRFWTRSGLEIRSSLLKWLANQSPLGNVAVADAARALQADVGLTRRVMRGMSELEPCRAAPECFLYTSQDFQASLLDKALCIANGVPLRDVRDRLVRVYHRLTEEGLQAKCTGLGYRVELGIIYHGGRLAPETVLSEPELKLLAILSKFKGIASRRDLQKACLEQGLEKAILSQAPFIKFVGRACYALLGLQVTDEDIQRLREAGMDPQENSRVRRLKQLLSIEEGQPVSSLRRCFPRALGKHAARFEDEAHLASVCASLGCRLENGRIYHGGTLRREDWLKPEDVQLLRVFQAAGGMGHRRALERIGGEMGVSARDISTRLNRAPFVYKLAPNLFALLGTEPTPEQVEACTECGLDKEGRPFMRVDTQEARETKCFHAGVAAPPEGRYRTGEGQELEISGRAIRGIPALGGAGRTLKLSFDSQNKTVQVIVGPDFSELTCKRQLPQAPELK